MQGLWIGAAGLHAGQRRLDIIAHNIANLNTTGFRANRPSFRDELSIRIARPALPATSGLPATGTGVALAAVQPDLRPGPLQVTDDPYHLAIEGYGFFRVGAGDGQVLYTRDGSFAPDADRNLTSADGWVLLDEDGDPVRIPPWAERFTIAADGTVSAFGGGRSETVATIALARFPNPGGLEARGQNLFAATPASGEPELVRPGEEGAGRLRQGALEAANVDLAQEMVAMLLAQRSFQLNARVVQMSDEMMGLANRLLG